MASKTGCTSVGELEITPRISAVAVCCSSASARRFSRLSAAEPLLFRALRASGALASTSAFAGLVRRRRGLSWPLTGLRPRWIDDRLGEGGRAGKWEAGSLSGVHDLSAPESK